MEVWVVAKQEVLRSGVEGEGGVYLGTSSAAVEVLEVV